MEANEVKILDSLDWYKLIIHTYKIVKYAQCKTHKHHIKPKCLYPELVDDYQNIIEVPEIVHWALHELLFDYYKQTSNKEAVSKLQKVNLEYFINECLRGASHFGPIKLYDFSKRDQIIDFIKRTAFMHLKNSKFETKTLDVCIAYRDKVNKKKIKDYTPEEKQKRKELNDIYKEAHSLRLETGRMLRKMNDEVLKRFFIVQGDELDLLTNDEVDAIISADLNYVLDMSNIKDTAATSLKDAGDISDL